MKKVITLICIFTVVFLSGCSFFNFETKTEIDGFSKKIKNQILEKYELTIPDSAVFLEGYEMHWQDSSINLMFSIPKKDFDGMLTDNWELFIFEDGGSEYGIHSGVGLFKLEDSKFICQYNYTKKAFTHVTYTEKVDGVIIVAFNGYRP